MTPMLEPVSSQAFGRSNAGPMRGFASGVKVMGPLTIVRIPPSASAGTRFIAASTMGSTRSRSGGSSSMPKSAGKPSTDHGRASFS